VGISKAPAVGRYTFSRLLLGRALEKEFRDPNSPFSVLTLYENAVNEIASLHSDKAVCHGDTNTRNFIVHPTTGRVSLIDFETLFQCSCMNDVIEDYKKFASNTWTDLEDRVVNRDITAVLDAAAQLYHHTEAQLRRLEPGRSGVIP
jgi:thiamine kinase-like enzyme